MRTRPAKYRVWDTVDKKFLAFPERVDIVCEGKGTTLTIRQGKLLLSQSTGIPDKNGDEIFEGDFVSHKVGSIKSGGLVEWSGPGAQWVKGNNQPLSTYQKTTEIVGNVYEHPKMRP